MLISSSTSSSVTQVIVLSIFDSFITLCLFYTILLGVCFVLYVNCVNWLFAGFDFASFGSRIEKRGLKNFKS